MKKVVSTIALFIFSFQAFCTTTLDLPYIIKYKKMGEHGYCFISRGKDDFSKIYESSKTIIICYTDLNLKPILNKQITLESRCADATSMDIIYNDSVFVVTVNLEQTARSQATQLFAYDFLNGKQIPTKVMKDVYVKFYPVSKSESNSETEFVSVTYSIEDEYNLTVSALSSQFKTKWTKKFHIENMNKHFANSFFFSTANVFGDKVYFNYYFDKYKGFKLLGKDFIVSSIDLKNGNVDASKTYSSNALTDEFSSWGQVQIDIVTNSSFCEKFPISYIIDSTFYKIAAIKKEKDEITAGLSFSKCDVSNIEGIEEVRMNGLKEDFVKKNFQKLKIFADYNARKSLDIIDGELFSTSFFLIKNNEKKNNTLAILKKIDLDNLKPTKTISFQSNNGIKYVGDALSGGPDAIKYCDALSRKYWYSFFSKLVMAGSAGEFFRSEQFNTETISEFYHLIYKDKSDNKWFVFLDWNEAKILPFVKAYNLETKAMKTLEWNPSFSNDESKIVQANILEGTDGNVLLYEIDEKGKAHFHFEAIKQ